MGGGRVFIVIFCLLVLGSLNEFDHEWLVGCIQFGSCVRVVRLGRVVSCIIVYRVHTIPLFT